jgi:hypothetical protein
VRLTGFLTGDERSSLERLVPGIDLDAVRLAVLPDVVTRAMPTLGGITIGHRIVIRPGVFEGDRAVLLDLLAHEMVHVAQWRRLGPAGFLVRYVTDYLRLRAGGSGHTEAYLRIPAEEEAREVASRRTDLRPE